MKIIIRDESRGRIRFTFGKKRFTEKQADMLLYYLLSLDQVEKAKVYQRTGSAAVTYTGEKQTLLKEILKFRFESDEIAALVPEHTGRALANEYQDRIVTKVVLHYLLNVVLPRPLRNLKALILSVKYLKEGLKCLWKKRLEVPVLDATAIGVSMLRNDFKTASSVMFLLGIGDILEEWTHKKSVEDLARSMALTDEKVWVKSGEDEVLVPVKSVKAGTLICVHMGRQIPLDGVVVDGEAMVNQASLTGEGVPVHKDAGAYVYAGTAVEEGDLLIRVEKAQGSTRYEKIIKMIEESEKLKAGLETKASNLADRLVPWSFAGTALTYLLTGNVTKAISILMVDFSCALKLSMPVSVLSAMREAQDHNLTVKGGRYLEAVAESDTLIFDKTGTLTKATPTVADVIPFNGMDEKEVLRIAACLEEHYPHSIANAVVKKAEEEGLDHEEMHKEVQYVVAHGIASLIDGKKVVIGSSHFVFEDEKVKIPAKEKKKFNSISTQYSHLYLAIGGKLAAVICIEDPLRPEAPEVIRKLHEAGFKHIVMMTGDSKHTAENVASVVGVDEFYAEVLPEDKASFVEKQKAMGHKVIMVGDGINDSPALSAADVGIAISEGAQIARDIADITISGSDLEGLLTLKEIANGLMKRVNHNYHFIIDWNLGLIALGLMSLIQPSTSALFHNLSTIGIGMHSLTNLLPDKKRETSINQISAS